jgi:hypothetical protein
MNDHTTILSFPNAGELLDQSNMLDYDVTNGDIALVQPDSKAIVL